MKIRRDEMKEITSNVCCYHNNQSGQPCIKVVTYNFDESMEN